VEKSATNQREWARMKIGMMPNTGCKMQDNIHRVS
jgi:hypothetical protein